MGGGGGLSIGADGSGVGADRSGKALIGGFAYLADLSVAGCPGLLGVP